MAVENIQTIIDNFIQRLYKYAKFVHSNFPPRSVLETKKYLVFHKGKSWEKKKKLSKPLKHEKIIFWFYDSRATSHSTSGLEESNSTLQLWSWEQFYEIWSKVKRFDQRGGENHQDFIETRSCKIRESSEIFFIFRATVKIASELFRNSELSFICWLVHVQSLNWLNGLGIFSIEAYYGAAWLSIERRG